MWKAPIPSSLLGMCDSWSRQKTVFCLVKETNYLFCCGSWIFVCLSMLCWVCCEITFCTLGVITEQFHHLKPWLEPCKRGLVWVIIVMESVILDVAKRQFHKIQWDTQTYVIEGSPWSLQWHFCSSFLFSAFFLFLQWFEHSAKLWRKIATYMFSPLELDMAPFLASRSRRGCWPVLCLEGLWSGQEPSSELLW